MTAIRVEALSKTYRQNKALNSMTFEIQKGAVAALVGENGAGKSTLLHILAGLIRPDSGVVEVNGSAPTQDCKWLSGIGFVEYRCSVPDLYRCSITSLQSWLPNFDLQSGNLGATKYGSLRLK